jgi:hypothetical protein
MIEDMSVRGFTEETRNEHVRQVRALAAFIRRPPDTATAEDLRRFQLHQRQSGIQPSSINSAVSALRFFFTVTLDRPDLARRLTVVLMTPVTASSHQALAGKPHCRRRIAVAPVPAEAHATPSMMPKPPRQPLTRQQNPGPDRRSNDRHLHQRSAYASRRSGKSP